MPTPCVARRLGPVRAAQAARQASLTVAGVSYDVSPVTKFAATWTNHNSNIWDTNLWSGTASALTADDTDYLSMFTGSLHSQVLKCTNFGFNLPATATVDGILFTAKCGPDQGAGVRKYLQASSRLYKAGVANGTNQLLGGEARCDTAQSGDNGLTADEVFSLGTSTDLWGDTWTGANVNDSGFGCGFAVGRTSGAGTTTIDYVSMTVYFH